MNPLTCGMRGTGGGVVNGPELLRIVAGLQPDSKPDIVAMN
jgi:hypothetical protein